LLIPQSLAWQRARARACTTSGAANRVRITLAHGAQSPGMAEFQIGAVLAERLGAGYTKFPGGHTAPLEIPGAFAAALRDVLTRLGG
jgi:pimeloyl-ACP methyl ester carboxylesterase